MAAVLLSVGDFSASAEQTPAQVDVKAWLEKLDADWQAIYQRDVMQPYEADKEKLARQYLTLLDGRLDKVSATGDLERSVIWRNEHDRFAAEKACPAEDDPTVPAELREARGVWRTELARLDQERTKRAQAVHWKYDQVLAQAQTQLTQRQRIDDALLVKRKREEVLAAWGIPPATATEPAPAAATPAPTAAPTAATGAKSAAKLAAVDVQGTVRKPLAIGANVFSDHESRFTQIPVEFDGFSFTQNNVHAGSLRFRVAADGLVYMACPSTFGGGGSGGAWQRELVSEDQLRRLGWERDRRAAMKLTDSRQSWLIFSRQCRRGEEFTIRTEKYAAPFLIVR